MKTNAEKYEFELFLEGIKVEFVGANIVSRDTGVEANIEIPCTRYISEIKPRTLVHLFFKRHSEDDWRLLFEGEVLGFSFNKSSNFNSFTISCRDLSSYFEIMYTFLYSIHDTFLPYSKIIRHFGSPRDTVDVISRSKLPDVKDEIISKAYSLINIVRSMITRIYGANPFCKHLRDNLKFDNRIQHINDSQLSKVLKLDVGKTILRRSPFNGLMTMRGVINQLFQMFFYETAHIGSPAFVNGIIKQFIFKPNNFLIPAPLCNIMFPNMISGLQTSRNFMSEPTRLMLPSKVGIVEEITGPESLIYMAYSPPEIEGIKNTVLHNALINDESLKGIVPVVAQLRQAMQLHGPTLKDHKNKVPPEQLVHLKSAADYMLQKMQTDNRSLSTQQGIFNPYVAAGFPGIVIADPYIIMGVIKTTNHIINSQGSISTSISMSNCRIASLNLNDTELIRIKTLKKNTSFNWSSEVMTSSQKALAKIMGEQNTAFPEWLNDNYKPALIDNTYTTLFGCKSIMSILGSPNTKGQTENIRALYNTFKGYESRNAGYVYSDKKTSRNIVTKKQLLETYLGQRKINNSMYAASEVFKQERREIILKHVGVLGGKVGIII